MLGKRFLTCTQLCFLRSDKIDLEQDANSDPNHQSRCERGKITPLAHHPTTCLLSRRKRTGSRITSINAARPRCGSFSSGRIRKSHRSRNWMHAQRSCTTKRETRGAKIAKNNAKESLFCTCGAILQQLSLDKTETLKERPAQVMIRFGGLQWLTRIRGLTSSADTWNKDADFRKCMQEINRTYETRISWNRVAWERLKTHNMTPKQRKTQCGD